MSCESFDHASAKEVWRGIDYDDSEILRFMSGFEDLLDGLGFLVAIDEDYFLALV